MKPRFSVIVPVYNGVPFVTRAIESVLAQTHPPHEVIVVDDGSTDATPAALAAFGGRVRVHRRENGGVSKARNAALPMVTGDYVAFLDADDVWFRRKLAAHAEAIERYPQAGAVFCNYFVRVGVLGNRLVKHYSGLRTLGSLEFDAPLRGLPFEHLLRENFAGTPSAAVLRRDVVERVGAFSDDHRPSEDYEYWLRCATVTDFLLLSEPLMYKRTHERNLSNDRIKNGLSHRKVLRDAAVRHAAYLRAHGLGPALRRALARVSFALGDLSYEAGRRREALRFYRDALSSDPGPRTALRFAWTVAKKGARSFSGGRLRRPFTPSYPAASRRARQAAGGRG